MCPEGEKGFMNTRVFTMVRFCIGIKGCRQEITIELVLRKFLLMRREEFH